MKGYALLIAASEREVFPNHGLPRAADQGVNDGKHIRCRMKVNNIDQSEAYETGYDQHYPFFIF